MKQRLYIDMDGVIVDFQSVLRKIDQQTLEQYKGVEDEIPELFDLMDHMPGAIEAVTELIKHYDTYILSTAPWLNPSAWTSKINWIHRYFGSEKDSPLYKRVIISHNKHLCKGDFLIDDRLKHGVELFEGEHIHFGTEKFPDWNTVLNYLIAPQKGYFEEVKQKIVSFYAEHKIGIENIRLQQGSVVSQFIVIPQAEKQLKKIITLEDDLALTLSRYNAIVYVPINKNYAVVGVANEVPKPIVVESAMEELHQQAQIQKLPLFLGENASKHHFADLAKMPHILIGGKAETGKTNLIHTMMRSLKATKTSDELAFVVLASQDKDVTGYQAVMDDYSVVGLDIMTTLDDAVQVLDILGEEMETRYDKLREAQMRNIVEYNSQIEPMSYLVVIADEFAPFITAAGNDFEYPLTRLAQLGRAVGIHLIIATNQCTTNIVTGLIKANVPARIAFQTEKQLDSKVILDAKRAVLLLPKNDIYFYEGNELIRIQTPND